eukprot:9489889-Pyramimonas_sp.AAC.1
MLERVVVMSDSAFASCSGPWLVPCPLLLLLLLPAALRPPAAASRRSAPPALSAVSCGFLGPLGRGSADLHVAQRNWSPSRREVHHHSPQLLQTTYSWRPIAGGQLPWCDLRASWKRRARSASRASARSLRARLCQAGERSRLVLLLASSRPCGAGGSAIARAWPRAPPRARRLRGRLAAEPPRRRGRRRRRRRRRTGRRNI